MKASKLLRSEHVMGESLGTTGGGGFVRCIVGVAWEV